MVAWGLDSIQVGLRFGVLSVTGTWKPTRDERTAAWELYVELVTRVSVVPLHPQDGLLREALTSFYSLFETTRDILKRHGPTVATPRPDGEYNLGQLAVLLLNQGVRPLLATWHPALASWEQMRPADVSITAHEDRWPDADRLRREMAKTRELLRTYADLLAAAAGVSSLTTIS